MTSCTHTCTHTHTHTHTLSSLYHYHLRQQLTSITLQITNNHLYTVVMTFNPTLFLAVVLGYLVGDYVCCDYKLDRKIQPSSFLLPQQQMASSSSSLSPTARFEVRWVRILLCRLLLLPSSSVANQHIIKAEGDVIPTFSFDVGAEEEEDIYAITTSISTPVFITQWALWLGPRVAR
jgi:hypothetical protein